MSSQGRLPATAWIAAIAVFVPVSPAHACSCVYTPLPELFAMMETVAKVELEPSLVVRGEGRSGTETWPIRSVEFFKGEFAVDKLTSDWAVCNPNIQTGKSYLVFSGKEGQVGTCSVRLLQEDAETNPFTSVLRAYKNRDISEPTEPWLFWRKEGTCRLTHVLDRGGARLVFEHSPGAPGFELKVRLPHADKIIDGSTYVRINNESWFTSGDNTFDAELAATALETLKDAVEIEVRATLQGIGPRWREDLPDYPAVISRTPSTFLGNSVELFNSCIQDVSLEQ